MTALTMLTGPPRLEEGASPVPLPWRRMAWVTWRQHRVALSGMTALLGVLALYVWTVGVQLHHAYGAAAACRPSGSLACGDLVNVFNNKDTFLANGLVLQALPALIGAFVGAPVLARELETGTFRYAWTQGFERWRWALAKLGLLAVAVTFVAGAMGALFSWYYQPYFAPGNQGLFLNEVSPLLPGLFDLRGVALAAWALAAFAIGGLVGLLVRRVVPAIAVTLAVYVGLALATAAYLRQHYLAPVVTSNPSEWVWPGSAWVVGQHWENKHGQIVSPSMLTQVLQGAPPQLAGKGGVPKAPASVHYLVEHGYTLWTTYQPASRFWPFQAIEGGWLLALAALLIAVTVWLVRHRAP